LLPQDILDYAKSISVTPHINYTHDKLLTDLQPTFVSFTRDLDKIRNTDVLDVCPELGKLFND
jgi:hypothetical protein